jgi:hypothetical protein
MFFSFSKMGCNDKGTGTMATGFPARGGFFARGLNRLQYLPPFERQGRPGR